MEEALKSIRLIHRVLLTVTFAVFLFALSPDREGQYKRAVGFLDQLKAIPISNYREWSEDEARKVILSRNNYLKDVVSLVKERGGPDIDFQDFLALGDEAYAQVLIIGQSSPYLESDNLDSINKDFREDIPILVPSLPLDRLANLIIVELGNRPQYKVDSLDIAFTTEISRMDVKLRVYDTDGELHSVWTTVDSGSEKLEKKSFHTWLKANGYFEAISAPDDQQVVFEPLRSIWPFIIQMKIDEAKNWIYQELLKADELTKLTVFGFSVSEGQAGVIAPTVTMILLLTLGAHLRHAYTIRKMDEENLLSHFPWIGLFSGPIGCGARVFTLFLFPLTANLWLLTRVSGRVAYVGWGIFTIMVLGGVWTLIEAMRLATRKRNDTENSERLGSEQ